MPIGTSTTALIYAVRKTPTRLSIQQQQKDFGWKLLQFLGIQVLALGLSVLTGGIASAVGLGAGLSNFAAAFISFGVETATDFVILTPWLPHAGGPVRVRPIEYNPPCAANSLSANQEIPRVLCNPNPKPDESNPTQSHPVLWSIRYQMQRNMVLITHGAL